MLEAMIVIPPVPSSDPDRVLGVWAAVTGPAAQTAARRCPHHRKPPFSGGEGLHPTDHDRFVKELVALTEIPAPPFKEERRATAYLAMLQQHGLSDVERDEEGNVMGPAPRRGADAGGARAPRHRVSRGHRRQGPPRGRLMAPGIGDDTRAWR